MLERCPRRAEVVLLTHEFAIGLPPVLRDGYRHFLRAADLRLLDLDQDLTNSLRGIKRQNQRLFTRLCGNPATCPRSSLTVERIVDRMARIFRANEHRRDSGDILPGGATRRRGLMCCQNFFAQHLILHVLEPVGVSTRPSKDYPRVRGISDATSTLMLSPFAAIKRRDREPNLNGGLASGTSPSAWRARATTSNSPGTTRRAGARPSTRPGWSTRRRARPAPGGSVRRGARRSEARGRRWDAGTSFGSSSSSRPGERDAPRRARFQLLGSERRRSPPVLGSASRGAAPPPATPALAAALRLEASRTRRGACGRSR